MDSLAEAMASYDNRDTSSINPAPSSTSIPKPASDAETTINSSPALATLSELLRITNNDVDRASQLANLLSRLSPEQLDTISSHSNPGGSHSSTTSATTDGNTAAAAAASSAGVAVAVSAPNSAATATVTPPSLLTQGSVSSSTATPFSQITSIPSGVTIDLGGSGGGRVIQGTQSTASRTNDGGGVTSAPGAAAGGSTGGTGSGNVRTRENDIADLTKRANRAFAADPSSPQTHSRRVSNTAANSAGTMAGGVKRS